MTDEQVNPEASDAVTSEAAAAEPAVQPKRRQSKEEEEAAAAAPTPEPAAEPAAAPVEAPVQAAPVEAAPAAPRPPSKPDRGQFGSPRSRGRDGRSPRGGRKVVRDVPKEGGERTAPEKKVASSADAWSAKGAEEGGGGSSNFADLFADVAVPKNASSSVGDKVTGLVVHAGQDGVFIDLGGARQQAYFPTVDLLNEKGELTIKAGDTLTGFVVRIDDGTPVLGKGLGKGTTMSTDELRVAMDEKIPVQGKVSGVNKGGVSVDIGGLRGFCPIGQLELRYVNDASIYLNQTLPFHVIEVKGDRDVVLSRRAILEAEKAVNQEALAERLTPGTRLNGKIVRVVEFGAFVDLGGVDGLIPTRELSYARQRPDEVVSVGQSVEVMVQEVTKKGDDLRITLSLKALADDPWENVGHAAPSGTVVQGTVRRLMDFGAFVELAPGIEGLLHVSELGAGARHPSSFLNVGQELLVTVQSVDPSKKRISLSPAPKDAAIGARVTSATLTVGDVVKVTAEDHQQFGIFVRVEGVSGKAGRGLVHNRELGIEHGVDVKKAFPLGTTFDAKVIDTTRLALSVKAIAEDEARATVKEYQDASQTKSMGTFADLLKKMQS